MNLTETRLKELLHYDPVTGEFRWKINRGTRGKAGCLAGSVKVDRSGRVYLRIKIDGTPYFAHRLAWFYVHGRWPVHDVDHKDGDGLKNAIDNLREASRAENARNRRRPATNTSGLKGVSWHSGDERFRAQISVGGRVKHLGNFKTAEEAHAAYCSAAATHYGSFARSE